MSVIASRQATRQSNARHAPRGGARHLAGTHPIVGTRKIDVADAARRLLRVLAAHPLKLAAVEARLAVQLARIALGRSSLRADADDRRFSDPAWHSNGYFRRVLQGYLAGSQALLELVESVRAPPADKRRALFLVEHLVAATAPSNFFLTHPRFFANAVATRGASVVRGLRHLAEDATHHQGLPRQVDAGAFKVGRDLAATEGAVIYRDEVFELIQYSPRSRQVDARPLLFCPPQINKFYVVDLGAENSFVRYALDAGQQMFCISWRNPTGANADWNLDTYVLATERAIDIVHEVAQADAVKLMAAGAGGLTAAVATARLAATGQRHKVPCLSLCATVLATARRDFLGPFADDAAIQASIAHSRSAGVLDGADVARAFAWQRPDDLVWHFVANNYVLGNAPAAVDVLYWNNDTTRLPAGLHADMLNIHRHDALSRPGALSVAGTAIDMSRIDCDVFVVAGERDPIAPWRDCYHATQIFHSNVRFVLSVAGHAHAIVCPPGSASARYYVNDDYAPVPDDWRSAAAEQRCSWWPAWLDWLVVYAGGNRPPPTVYGNDDYPPIEAAPGRYVRQQ